MEAKAWAGLLKYHIVTLIKILYCDKPVNLLFNWIYYL